MRKVNMKTVRLVVVLSLIIAASLFTFACAAKPAASNPSNPLVGTWKLVQAADSVNTDTVSETWEFHEDGTYVQSTKDISFNTVLVDGTYKILNETHLEIDVPDKNEAYEYSISGNGLTLTSGTTVTTLKK
jgi:hypothetical protein